MIAHIEEVSLGDDGEIAQLILATGKAVEGDFFIDCTGFRAHLMSALGAEFVSYEDHLPVNRAVTARGALEGANTVPRSYTTAMARGEGWTFEIDLGGRRGLGYVFSGSHLDEETAGEQFRSFFSIPETVNLNRFEMQVGRLREPWKKNCMAIGLSSGFIEPLESTGIYMIEIALRFFVDYFDLSHDNIAIRNKFNRSVTDIFDELKDFVVLHYVMSARRDTDFWRDITAQELSQTLQEKLELWRRKAPTDADLTGVNRLFQAPNYAAILFGMEHLTENVPFGVSHISPQESMVNYEELNKLKKFLVSSLPSHSEYLQKVKSTFM